MRPLAFSEMNVRGVDLAFAICPHNSDCQLVGHYASKFLTSVIGFGHSAWSVALGIYLPFSKKLCPNYLLFGSFSENKRELQMSEPKSARNKFVRTFGVENSGGNFKQDTRQ